MVFDRVKVKQIYASLLNSFDKREATLLNLKGAIMDVWHKYISIAIICGYKGRTYERIAHIYKDEYGECDAKDVP